MGNMYSTRADIDDIDGVLFDLEGEEYSYQDNLIHVLHCIANRCTMKMPVIKKHPDLNKLLMTNLYKETKALSGYADDNMPSTEKLCVDKMLRNRENGLGRCRPGAFTWSESRRIANMYVPNRKIDSLMSLESKVFCGLFNKSGTRFITASQGHLIRIYDSSRGLYNKIHSITVTDVGWGVLDIDFSPDEQHFVYSTWSDYLNVISVNNKNEDIQSLALSPEHPRTCVFSVRFSPCGNVLVGGANDGCIYLYDRTVDHRTTRLQASGSEHSDINAVSFIGSSPHLFVSGCDSGIMKLWDKRSVDSSRSEAVSVFFGHFDGITYIDPRNDERYLLSNSKDQSIKIWDLRSPSPKEKEGAPYNLFSYNWDYRWDNVPREFYNPQREIDGDVSVMTYRGHRVTKSLIRAKFSPSEQTGQRYIYTGCGTGRVIIYDILTGKIHQAIEGHKDIVRDVAWHPIRSEIISSSWDWRVNINRFNSPVAKRLNSTVNIDVPLRRSRRIAHRKAQSRKDETED